MNPIAKNFLLLTLMVAASGFAVAMRPTHKIAEKGPAIELKTLVPLQFGDWHEEIVQSGLIVDPQQSELVKQLYSQTLSRTYKNATDKHIMLSIAYGTDQRDGNQLHYPEVCYPAQGFQLLSQEVSQIALPEGIIPIRRIETKLGNRHEFVTYWAIIGDNAVLGGVKKKLVEMQYGLRGQIPDGLLFRVSSISDDSNEAYKLQEQFVASLLRATPGDFRPRLFGQAGKPGTAIQ